MNSRQFLVVAIAILFSGLSVAAEYTSGTALVAFASADIDSNFGHKSDAFNDDDKSFPSVLTAPTTPSFKGAVDAFDVRLITSQPSNSPPIRSPPRTLWCI